MEPPAAGQQPASANKQSAHGGALVVTFWVFFALMVVVIVVLVVLLIVSSVYVGNYVEALYGAFFNTNTCIDRPLRCEYVYSDPPTPTSFPEQFDPTIGLFVAQQVFNVEYYPETQNLHVPATLSLVGLLYTQEVSAPVFGYVASDNVNRTLYLIFRGTETSMEWGFDLRFAQEPFSTAALVPPPNRSVSSTLSPNWDCGAGAMVHDGFLSLFRQMATQILTFTQSALSSVDRIVVAGHSLGAAISSIVSAFISADVTTLPTFCYTFGKPRVGNVDYAGCLTARFINRFFRVENNDDVVPTLPLSCNPNVDDWDNPWLYQHEGQQITYQSNWGSIQLNHSMNNYINFLRYAIASSLAPMVVARETIVLQQ